MEKETEEQTLERLTNFYRKHYGNGFEYKDIESLIDLSGPEATKNMMIRFAKDYHSERIKQLVSSDAELIDKAYEYSVKQIISTSSDFRCGANYILKLLTKGE